jgi:hypothetical protein
MIFAKKKKKKSRKIMIFERKKMVWCDDRREDQLISIFAGSLGNHDRAHLFGQNFCFVLVMVTR